MHVQALVIGVDGDPVAFLQQADGAADRSFRCHMADHQAIGAAGEAPIGDQAHAIAQSGADQRRSGGKHLAHARPALGAFVANHDHIAGLDLVVQDGGHGGFFGIEDSRRAGKVTLLDTRHLRDGAFGGEVALEHGQVSFGINRVAPGPNHRLVGIRFSGHLSQGFGQGLAGQGERVAVQQAMVQQHAHHLWHATGAVELGGDEAAGGLEVAQDRDAAADDLEIVDGERHLGGAGDGQQVQHGVGGAADGHDHGDGILERLAGQQVTGADVEFDGAHQRAGRGAGAVGFLAILGGHRGGVGEADAHGLERRGHGVGGVHAATGAGAGAGMAFHVQQGRIVDLVGGIGAHGLEGADDGQVAAMQMAGLDGPAIDENGGDVQPRDGHHGAGHVLVAAADGDEAIHELAVADGFDGVGDHLARDQGIAHSRRAHGNAVRDGDGAEQLRHDARLAQCPFGARGQGVQAHVAGGDGAEAVGDAHHRLVEIAILEAHGAQHGAIGGALGALSDDAAAFVVRHGRLLGPDRRGWIENRQF